MAYYTCKQEIHYILFGRFSKCYFAILLVVLLSFIFTLLLVSTLPKIGSMLVVSLALRMALISLMTSIILLIMLLMLSMGAILILTASWMLIFGLCEGVSFWLRLQLQLMMRPSIVCELCAKLMVFLNLLLSGSLCWLIIKISFSVLAAKKNRPAVGSSAAGVCFYAVRSICSYAMSNQKVFRS